MDIQKFVVITQCGEDYEVEFFDDDEDARDSLRNILKDQGDYDLIILARIVEYHAALRFPLEKEDD